MQKKTVENETPEKNSKAPKPWPLHWIVVSILVFILLYNLYLLVKTQ